MSRVIQNNPKISKATSAKVKKAMTKLGYTPNHSARSLITNKTLTIGLIAKSSAQVIRQNPFNGDVLNGINQACNQRSYSTRMTVSDNIEDLYMEVKNMILSKSVDGFILLYSLYQDKIEQLLNEQKVPYIIVGKSLNYDNIIQVDNDIVIASYNLTRYLFSLGHRKMLFIKEDGNYAVSEDRTNGFKQFCDKHQIAYQILEIKNDTDLTRYIKQFCIGNNHFKPTMIITSDAMVNMQLLKVLYEQQLHVPNQIQTATFNTSFLTENAAPSQTSVCINPERLGKEAGNIIIDKLNHLPISFSKKEIETQIVIRDSTKQIERGKL